MSRPRLVVADDHQIVLEGLERLLSPDYEVVASVGDGRALVRAVVEHAPDLVVADFSMPGMDALEALRELGRLGIATRMVVLTMHDDPEYAVSALKEGVYGYVLKNAASTELMSAIRDALSGRVWLSPLIAQDVLHAMESGAPGRQAKETRLTDRQREILVLLTQGRLAKEIAAQLGISRRTVEYHKYKLMQALGLGTTAELIQYAVRRGLDRP